MDCSRPVLANGGAFLIAGQHLIQVLNLIQTLTRSNNDFFVIHVNVACLYLKS